jgi:hypothetical protein
MSSQVAPSFFGVTKHSPVDESQAPKSPQSEVAAAHLSIAAHPDVSQNVCAHGSVGQVNVPTHSPSEQVSSSLVHVRPSSHASPLFAPSSHTPLLHFGVHSLLVPVSQAVPSALFVPSHWPWEHVSSVVHSSPSVQVVPSLRSAVWQPTPALQESSVQGLPSLQAFVFVSHEPVVELQ